MQADLITAKESLTKILTSKDVKATVCATLLTPHASKDSLDILYFATEIVFIFFIQLLEMVEKNELNRSLLALLDENIASAQSSEQVRTVNKIFFYLVKLDFFMFFSLLKE